MMATPPHHDGLLLRARYTPMRDVIRLRLTGRLNIRGLIDKAKLPPPLAELVLHITRRTRLSRLEKSDVAQELIAHFADGLDAGRSAEQLRENFGDADQAARLIRRAKRRNHTTLQRLPRYGAYGLGVLALFYLVIAIRFFSGSPNIAHDYLADLNRVAAEAAPELRGWPIYRQALLMLDEQPTWDHAAPTRPGDPGWEELAAYVKDHAHALALAREAAAMPYLGYIAGHHVSEADSPLWPDMQSEDCQPEPLDASLIAVLLPHLRELRSLSKLLICDARRAALEGDEATVMANIIAVLGISEHAREVPTLISELVSISAMSLAMDTTGDLLADHADVISDESLLQLAHQIAAAHGGGVFRVDISAERIWFRDVAQRLYTDDGRGNGRVTAEGVQWLITLGAAFGPELTTPDLPWYAKLTLPAATLLMANRRDMVAKYETLMDRAELEGRMPLWNRHDTVESEVEAMMGDMWQRARYAPIAILMPAMTKATMHGEQITMRRDAALAAIALQLHYRRNGTWPASLHELVPHFLPQVPLDRFDGQPMRYVIMDGSPILYCLGTNLEDNGGRAPDQLPGEAARWMHPEQVAQLKQGDELARSKLPDGDWVLWPPAR